MSDSRCPFCSIAAERVFHAGRSILAVWDAFPISPGHALIIPKRHVGSWFEASSEERGEMIAAIERVRDVIAEKHKPDGFNIGINDGESAGQTVPHLHLHVIPRYSGDVPDPRGGIRHVIPTRVDYRSGEQRHDASSTPSPGQKALVRGDDDPLLPYLVGHLDEFSHVQMAVAFVLPSGVRKVEPHLREMLSEPRCGSAQILTGDYQDWTEPIALQRLLDLREQTECGDRLALRVFEARDQSFHPKAYIFHDQHGPQVAYVGSSNLSSTALGSGVEWNYRVIPARDQAGIVEVEREFRALWSHPSTTPLTQEWLDTYRQRRRPQPDRVGVPVEPAEPPPKPHGIQEAALGALEETRAQGNSAGLVVLATGLGKTWLSAFDSNRREFRRVLFVAHREEILAQAMDTFRRIRPDAHLGMYTGQEKAPDADVVFASIQTLGRLPHLSQFDPTDFDYLVVDEFHHAAANTYRRVIDHFEPKFLLGLTATPERTDGGDLLGLCQENLAFRCDLHEGIRRGLLCSFKYFGVPDEVDYSNIPWRNNRFNEEKLEQAVATQKRAQNALQQYRDKGGDRTLAFCCSKRHADFMAEYFEEHGVRSVAVHSGAKTAPRASSLDRLRKGELDVVFTVDMFNEGVDLPNVDTVLMLRPTESRILWQQQFGRGLRVAEGKSHLTVIDYIGNHRVFLIKPQTLLQLGGSDFELREALQQLQAGNLELPPGCEVTYELKAVDILTKLLRIGDTPDTLALFYLSFKDRYNTRPTASECSREGYRPRAARKSHGSWLGFVRAQGDLTEDQSAAMDQAGEFLATLDVTQMTRSYKMLVLLAMLNRDRLPGSIDIGTLTEEFGRIARRSARLSEDVGKALESPSALQELIEQNPIAAWVGGKGTGGRPYFRYQNGSLTFALPVAERVRGAFQELAREVVEWRLAEYLARQGTAAGPDRFTCKVSHANSRPMLFLPDREKHPDIPYGWTPIIANGNQYEGNFVKIALNVVRHEDSENNELPEIVHGWFGPDAGRPGTNFQVVFERSEAGYVANPDRLVNEEARMEIGESYSRERAAQSLGLRYKGRNWQTGFVFQDNKMILFVTLEKEGLGDQYAYRDRFLSADKFEWQSQNRTPQRGVVGERIRHHSEKGIEVHLFVRKKAKSDGQTLPFFYCGQLRFLDWEGEKPITVRWRMESPLSEALQGAFLRDKGE